MSDGNGHQPAGGVTPIGMRPGKPSATHRVYVEELLAHLTGQHACQQAGAYTETVIGELIQARAGSTPLGPDGTASVSVDAGEALSHEVHLHRLQDLHRDHSHDYRDAGTVGLLHPWMREESEHGT